MQTALTIAGFDPSSGAGITADLMVFAAHGIFGISCITSLTVQSTVGVASTHPIAPEIIQSTLNCLQADLPAGGIKIGMLSNGENVAAVADFLSELRVQGNRIPVILDPVLRSSSGRELLDPDGVGLLKKRLLPLVDWITPNIDELGILTGRPVSNKDDLVEAAQMLQEHEPNLNIFATRGHLERPDDFVLTADGRMHWLPGERIITRSTHGTGCALSSALLSRIMLGDEVSAASFAAKKYITEAIRTASPLGQGHGPINHLWPLH
jgi:hydroxymethylpyrimidine/phosphomethylpyrimidine kinase